ncbi:alpha-L-rhamnosidase C-terminal domain-containing protein [Amycolatopsis sp.]|uniref:alpha-L-rhamnosidase C-terminal domain-containing protein n=1 Tax=Amycolatopsis sp. TaxID=37632 RepID=UPI00345826E8
MPRIASPPPRALKRYNGPVPSDLTWAEGQVPTPHGTVQVSWAGQRGVGQFSMSVTAPAAAPAAAPARSPCRPTGPGTRCWPSTRGWCGAAARSPRRPVSPAATVTATTSISPVSRPRLYRRGEPGRQRDPSRLLRLLEVQHPDEHDLARDEALPDLRTPTAEGQDHTDDHLGRITTPSADTSGRTGRDHSR